MNNILLITGLSVALIAGGVTQSMADGDSKMKPKFEDIDTDGDGSITKAEMMAHRQERFAKTDSDGNGSISKEEMMAQAAQRMSRRYALMLEKFDADGDGEMSMDEMAKRHKGGMFAQMDEDGDGAISAEEFKAMKRKNGKHHGGSGASE